MCSPSGSCGAFVTLFSDLSLGPGDYFLTLGPRSGGGTVGWFPAINLTVIEDTGVALGPCLAASAAAPYPPASPLGPPTGQCGPDNVMIFTVTGTATTPVPEPATPTLIGFAALLLISARRVKLAASIKRQISLSPSGGRSSRLVSKTGLYPRHRSAARAAMIWAVAI